MAVIGIFDSGSGGLSVLKEIRKVLPSERYIYYSDNAHCPYGEKSAEYIQERARVITRLLLDRGADIIVVACNTATGAAIATLRAEFDVPFVGMEPAVKPAALGTRSGVIGVLATAGTLKASKYLNTKGQFQDNVRIEEHVGEGFVQLVERGELDGPEAERVVRACLAARTTPSCCPSSSASPAPASASSTRRPPSPARLSMFSLIVVYLIVIPGLRIVIPGLTRNPPPLPSSPPATRLPFSDSLQICKNCYLCNLYDYTRADQGPSGARADAAPVPVH